MLGTVDTNILIFAGLYMLAMLYTTVLVFGSATAAFLMIRAATENETLRLELKKARNACQDMAAKAETLWLETARLRLENAEVVDGLRIRLRKLRKEERHLRARLKRRGRLLSVAGAEHLRLVRERNDYRIRLALLQAECNWRHVSAAYEMRFLLSLDVPPDLASCAEAWQRLEAAATSEEPVEGEVIAISHDGLILDVGVPAFLPAALIDIPYATELEGFLWHFLKCRVMEVDRRRGRVLLSRCSLLFEERKERCEEAVERFRRGEIVNGRVVKVEPGGVRVEVSPGVIGFLPSPPDAVQDTYNRHSILNVGDEVRVVTVAIQSSPFLLALALA